MSEKPVKYLNGMPVWEWGDPPYTPYVQVEDVEEVLGETRAEALGDKATDEWGWLEGMEGECFRADWLEKNI